MKKLLLLGIVWLGLSPFVCRATEFYWWGGPDGGPLGAVYEDGQFYDVIHMFFLNDNGVISDSLVELVRESDGAHAILHWTKYEYFQEPEPAHDPHYGVPPSGGILYGSLIWQWSYLPPLNAPQ